MSVLLLASSAASAVAQRPGSRNRVAFEAEAGAAVPADTATRTGAAFSGAVKVSVSQSVEIGVFGGSWSGASDFGRDSKETYFGTTLERRWPSGRFRPFLNGGLGLYSLKFHFELRNRFASSDTETRVGGFAGTGVEISLSPSVAVVPFARYHLTAGPVNRARSGFLDIGVGLRAAL